MSFTYYNTRTLTLFTDFDKFPKLFSVSWVLIKQLADCLRKVICRHCPKMSTWAPPFPRPPPSPVKVTLAVSVTQGTYVKKKLPQLVSVQSNLMDNKLSQFLDLVSYQCCWVVHYDPNWLQILAKSAQNEKRQTKIKLVLDWVQFIILLHILSKPGQSQGRLYKHRCPSLIIDLLSKWPFSSNGFVALPRPNGKKSCFQS